MIKFLLINRVNFNKKKLKKNSIALIGIINSITRELPDNPIYFFLVSLQTGLTTYIFIRIFYTISEGWFSHFDCIYLTKRSTMDMRRLN